LADSYASNPTHLNPMGVVDQPVGDAIGQSGITNLFVPARDRQLRGQDRGAHLVTILAISQKYDARSPTGVPSPDQTDAPFWGLPAIVLSSAVGPVEINPVKPNAVPGGPKTGRSSRNRQQVSTSA